MVISFLLEVLATILNAFSYWLPTWTIWPQSFYDAINYFIGKMSILQTFNIPLDVLFQCLTRFIDFIILYFGARLLMMFLNWARGSGEIKL